MSELTLFSCFWCCLLTLSKLTFSVNSFRNTISLSNGLNPDKGRHSVSPDLGPKCLYMLSADDKSMLAGKELRAKTVTL